MNWGLWRVKTLESRLWRAVSVLWICALPSYMFIAYSTQALWKGLYTYYLSKFLLSPMKKGTVITSCTNWFRKIKWLSKIDLDIWSFQMSPGDSKCVTKAENHWCRERERCISRELLARFKHMMQWGHVRPSLPRLGRPWEASRRRQQRPKGPWGLARWWCWEDGRRVFWAKRTVNVIRKCPEEREHSWCVRWE